MSDFYIVPPRLIVGSLQRSNVVTSLNTLRGDLSFKVNPDTGLTLNINSGVFTFSVAPDFYIKKSGDIVPSNIIFQPDPGKYGLAVGSGAADPGTGVSGALYFNTTYNVLKVYDGTTWNEIASTGTSGITQSFADTRYLRLDGGNVPTSAISMGSQFLRFANLTTRVTSGTAGQVYYNTDTNKLDLYNGSSWVAVGSGITSITAGSGISLSSNPITSYGSVSVNEAYNFNWTGTHTYSQPITFSTSQTFDASKLTIPYEVQGDILHFDGTAWARFPLGTPNQVLSVSNCGADVEWHSLVAGQGIGISYAAGQLIFTATGGSGGGGGGLGNSVYISTEPPLYTPTVGDLWWDSDSGGLNIYYSDGDSTQWVEVNSFIGGIDPIQNIYGITSINGLIGYTQDFAVGTSGNNFNISSSGNTHTFNIPIAGSGKTGLITGLPQIIAGTKTFDDGIVSSAGATIYGSLYLPDNPLIGRYGGTGYTSYSKGDMLVGLGSTFFRLPVGTNSFVIKANSNLPSGLGWTSLSSAIVSMSAPTPAYLGDLWWNSEDGSLNIYYTDGDSDQWVEVGNAPTQGASGASTIISASYFTASYGYLETVYDHGTSSGSITPNWNNGSTQKITLNGGLTLNVPINMLSGSTMKFIIRQNASGNHTLSANSSLKFKGGNKTLSTASNAIDMIKIYYDGTSFLCDLDLAYS
jgi:hypothetical protein